MTYGESKMPDYTDLIYRKLGDCKLSKSGKGFSGEEAIVRGYWIWWCNSHHQPWTWCSKDIAVKMLQAQWEEMQKVKKVKTHAQGVAENVESNLPVIEQAVKGIRQKLEALE